MHSVDLAAAKETFQKGLLKDLERLSDRLKTNERQLNEIQDLSLQALKLALQEQAIRPYHACMAVSRLVDAYTKQSKLRLEVYDRLQGATTSDGTWMAPEDTEESETEKVAYITADIRARAELAAVELIQKYLLPADQG